MNLLGSKRSYSAGVAGGVLWAIAGMLVVTVPPPFTYDTYNRIFTFSLMLVLYFWASLRRRLTEPGRLGALGWGLVLAGLGVQLAGNVTEFWGVLLQDRPAAYAASARGSEPWVGSQVGFMIFGLGALLIAIGSVLVGTWGRRHRAGKRWLPALVAGLAGLPWGVLIFPLIAGTAWAWLGASLRRSDGNE